MSALDRFTEAAAARLDLGFRARTVVGVLVGWIGTHPLGLDGLAQQFEQAGLGPRFRQWQCAGEPAVPLLPSELERAVGAHALATLARRTGLPPGTFRVIACDLLPGLVPLMTPAHQQARAQAAVLRRQRQREQQRGPVRPAQAVHGLARRSMLWLLIGLAIISISAWLHLKMHAPLWVPPPASAPLPAQLSLRQHGHLVLAQGTLHSDAERRRLWNALVALYGKGQVTADLHVDPRVAPARWLDRLLPRLPQLQGNGLVLDFHGDQVQVDSLAMDDAQRLAVSQLLRRDFPDLHSTGLWGPGLAALAELDALPDPAQLVAALNQTSLTFRRGTAHLNADSSDTLRAVAAAVQALPHGVRLEIAAHTDSQGDAAANLALSQQRALAVARALQAEGVPATRLVPVGQGQQQPVADNRSEAGRARNRRITYAVLSPDAPARRSLTQAPRRPR